MTVLYEQKKWQELETYTAELKTKFNTFAWVVDNEWYQQQR